MLMQQVLVSDSLLKEVLSGFLGKELEICCPRRAERCCDDGQCVGQMSLKGNVYSLTTGIIPGADFLGGFTFELKDVKSISALSNGSAMITAHHGKGSNRMRFRIKSEKEKQRKN
jgi:hypothetical protein